MILYQCIVIVVIKLYKNGNIPIIYWIFIFKIKLWKIQNPSRSKTGQHHSPKRVTPNEPTHSSWKLDV